jgi:hypothetical protein
MKIGKKGLNRFLWKALLAVFILVFSFSCVKVDTSPATYGWVTFYAPSDFVGRNIRVYVNQNPLGLITDKTGNIPDCKTTVNPVYKGVPGVYDYTATSEDGGKWKGELTIKDGQCASVLINLENAIASSPGKATLYTDLARIPGGYITIKFDGDSIYRLDSITPTGVPNCDFKGNVTYKNKPGTYNYTASTRDSSLQWEGSVTITKLACSAVNLNSANAIKGNAVIWASDSTMPGRGIEIYMGTVLKGRITRFQQATPACGANGAVTINATPGTYRFTARTIDFNHSITWDSTFTILAKSCTTKKLNKP